MKRIVLCILVFALAFSLCSCTKKSEEKYLGENPDAVEQYLEYAKQLEDAGNSEAAAQIYTMIDKAAGADAVYEIGKGLQDEPKYQMKKDMDKTMKLYREWKKVLEK